MKQYVVDAFTDSVFHDNQAAVCVLEQWPDEALMMNITQENNFSETAFTVKEGEKWHLRWFTPGGEIHKKGLPVTGIKSDDRELALCLAQPSKVELFLKVKVRRPSA